MVEVFGGGTNVVEGISRSESMSEICGQIMTGLSCFPWNGANCSSS